MRKFPGLQRHLLGQMQALVLDGAEPPRQADRFPVEERFLNTLSGQRAVAPGGQLPGNAVLAEVEFTSLLSAITIVHGVAADRLPFH